MTQVASRASVSGHQQVDNLAQMQAHGTLIGLKMDVVRNWHYSNHPRRCGGSTHFGHVTPCLATMARILRVLLRGHGSLGLMASLALFPSVYGTSPTEYTDFRSI